jgi:hypothetical protein
LRPIKSGGKDPNLLNPRDPKSADSTLQAVDQIPNPSFGDQAIRVHSPFNFCLKWHPISDLHLPVTPYGFLQDSQQRYRLFGLMPPYRIKMDPLADPLFFMLESRGEGRGEF